jgi:hypothetical protein
MGHRRRLCDDDAMSARKTHARRADVGGKPVLSDAPAPSDAWRRLGRAGPNAGELELLRAATLDVDAASAAWRRWFATNVIDIAHHRSTDLLPAVAVNLPPDVLGPEADRLRGIRRRVWAANQLGFSAMAAAVDVLGAAGIEPVLVKGAALATTVYPEPGTRVMADIDLVVGSEGVDDAVEALLAAGWNRVDPVEGPFFHAVAVVDESGCGVDVHRWVVFPRFAPVPERSWLERAVPHEVLGRRVRRLVGSDELILAVLHGMLTNSDSASRWPIDVVKLATAARGDDDFWPSVIASATELRVGPVVADGVAMCAAELGAPVPAGALEALRDAPLDGALRRHWALCRHGVTPEWRIRRYARLARSEGARPTVRGYVAPRWQAIRTRGIGTVVRGRLERARTIVDDRTRS